MRDPHPYTPGKAAVYHGLIAALCLVEVAAHLVSVWAHIQDWRATRG